MISRGAKVYGALIVLTIAVVVGGNVLKDHLTVRAAERTIEWAGRVSTVDIPYDTVDFGGLVAALGEPWAVERRASVNTVWATWGDEAFQAEILDADVKSIPSTSRVVGMILRAPFTGAVGGVRIGDSLARIKEVGSRSHPDGRAGHLTGGTLRNGTWAVSADTAPDGTIAVLRVRDERWQFRLR